MSHTYAQNVVHVAFSTKDRRKAIPEPFQSRLWEYTGGVCRNIGILLLAMGGTEDHVHMLVQIPPSLPLAKAVATIKANSSRWAYK